MKIELKKIKIRDLTAGYSDRSDEGVVGYSQRLNIRPAYQREFIYKETQRNEVINTVRKDFPLNTMYWVVAGEGFELMDGQQRTVSICQYVQGDFSVEFNGSPMFFNNLTTEKKNQILDYELSIYVCEGTDDEKLDWFKIINIAGEKLTPQELRNAIYTGTWLSDAKRWFSKPNGPAYQISQKYVNGSPIRQELLEKALEWISNEEVEKYMSEHQHDADASELWQYYQEVISWVTRIFPNYRNIMKGIDWGRLHSRHKDQKINFVQLEAQIVTLIEDDEVNNKKGIYEYLLTGDDRKLNLRAFDPKTKLAQYEKQKGICLICKKFFEIDSMQADHIVPWSKGGKTVPENCQLLCTFDNNHKGAK